MKCFSYRVYDKKEKQYSDATFSIDQHGIVYIQDEDGYWEEIDEERYVVELCTDLEDKNGKMIHEGDIVNAIGVGIAQVIDSPSGEWILSYRREPDEIEDGFACVVPKNKPSGLWKTALTSYIEIVGNIHENGDLLND